MLVNSGRDRCALQLAGGGQTGYKGTSTGVTATTLTNTGATFATAGTGLKGQVVVTGQVYGIIVSNTATVLTIDQWYDPTAPTGAAASTPATGSYVIAGWMSPAWYTALTADVTSPAATDTALASEITTAGLKRKQSTYAHTAGAQTYTLTTTYTAQAGDVGSPVTVAKMGTFDCLTGASGLLFHETLVSPTATLSAAGDQLTLTQTVTMT